MKRVKPLLVVYLLLALLFFVFVAVEVLNGRMNFQFYADSKTYEEIALYGSTYENLTEIGHNTYGPVAILKLLGPRNYFLIFLFNIGILILSLYLFSKNNNLNQKTFATLLLIQPITFTSLMSINKELICLLCVALIIYNHERKSKIITIVLFGLTYLARWQFTLFYILYLLLFSKLNKWREKRLFTIIISLLVISIGLFITRNSFLSDVFSVYDRLFETQDAHGSGIFRRLMFVQDNYGYIVAFIPKTIFLFLSLIRNYNYVFDFSDAYNNTIMFLQSLANLFVLIKMYKKRLYSIENTYFYLSVIYCMVFVISPVFCPRYLYPAIVFMCYELALKSHSGVSDKYYKKNRQIYNYEQKNENIENNNQCKYWRYQ